LVEKVFSIMSRGFLFKTILIYELLAFAMWNIIARTEGTYEGWLADHIHGIVYITLATTMLFVTFVYIVQWSLDRLGITKKISEIKDPRRDVSSGK